VKRNSGPRRLLIAVVGKQPGLAGTADAQTTGVVSGEVEVRGETQTLEP
jgi:hypothetical protein